MWESVKNMRYVDVAMKSEVNMVKKQPDLAKDLFDIVSAIQANRRQSVADQVARLASHLGCEDDLLVDRRSLNWRPGGKARTTVELRQASPRPAPKSKKANLKVTWRGSGSAMMTLEEAAKTVRRAQSSMRVYLSRGGGRCDFTVDDEIITVERT